MGKYINTTLFLYFRNFFFFLCWSQLHKQLRIQVQQPTIDKMVTKATEIMIKNTQPRGKHFPTICLRRGPSFSSVWQYEISL